MRNAYSRQQALSSLHPKIRKPVADILAELHREDLNFEVFESWRTPELQKQYFSKGRNSKGEVTDRSRVITFAKPWQSFHQYGLAVDLVLKEGKKWSWDDTGANAKKWQRMHEIARAHGLQPLSFEKPHIQLSTVKNAAQLHAGNYPAGGDNKWMKKLSEEINSWKSQPPAPPLPAVHAGRPPIGAPDHDGLQTTGEQAFTLILAKIFELEGGYSNHPADPGGPTNMGITLATLARWRKQPVSVSDIRNLTRQEAEKIYRKTYFEPTKAGQMPASLALHVFNTAVLSGPKRSGEILQHALNSTGNDVAVDGIVGPQTLAAVHRSSAFELCDSFEAAYLKYLRGLGHWPTFGKGWTNRLGKISRLARQLLNMAPSGTGKLTSASDQKSKISTRVYLFSGLFGKLFSSGLDELAENLSGLGFQTVVLPWNQRSTAEKEIIRKFGTDELRNVILIGHSLGANTAVRIANALKRRDIPVSYLATIDPTIRANSGAARFADNFRSSDIRDRRIKGALEMRREDLRHTEIDNDKQVHARITAKCIEVLKPNTTENEKEPMTEIESTRAGTSETRETVEHPKYQDIAALIAAIMNQFQITGNNQHQTTSASEIMDIINILTGNRVTGSDVNPMTPVNSALGSGALGQFLNGRKTAIGILGLVAIHTLPVLFPSAAPILASLEALGFEKAATNPEAGTGLMTAIFAGFAAWGGLGKLEKWVHRLEQQRGQS